MSDLQIPYLKEAEWDKNLSIFPSLKSTSHSNLYEYFESKYDYTKFLERIYQDLLESRRKE